MRTITRPTPSTTPYTITPRKVDFDWRQSPLHWLPDDVFSSYGVNEFSYLLTQGERFFCRTFREALPHVTDAKLRDDVRAFIHQEAIHSHAHLVSSEQYLERLGVRSEAIRARNAWLFDHALVEKPFGRELPREGRDAWLRIRVGLVATIEHFTASVGQYFLESKAWEKNGADPVVADLFLWHCAEEVEHRSVAYDLYLHLGGTHTERRALMGVALPTLIGLMAVGTSDLLKQDEAVAPEMANVLRPAFWKAWNRGAVRGNFPGLPWYVERAARFMRRDYDPQNEASTELALAYIATSKGVLDAASTRSVSA